jgi:hypothetical protein
MHLIQILLPLYDNRGRRLPNKLFDDTSRSLAKSHGGVTAYSRSPAVGLWTSRGSQLKRDEIIVYEVVTPDLKPKSHVPTYRVGVCPTEVPNTCCSVESDRPRHRRAPTCSYFQTRQLTPDSYDIQRAMTEG